MHGDLKPGNIMWSGQVNFKLLTILTVAKSILSAMLVRQQFKNNRQSLNIDNVYHD